MPSAHPHRAHRLLGGVAVLAVAMLAAGCLQTASKARDPGTRDKSVVTTHRSRVVQGGLPLHVVIAAGDAANGTTMHARVGDRVELTLSSDYWTVEGSSAPAVLRQNGATVQLPRQPHCPPGVGCAPLRTGFTALAPGTAMITATRTTCGEALRCVGSQGRFALTVVVQ
jgi:hypothetical protein